MKNIFIDLFNRYKNYKLKKKYLKYSNLLDNDLYNVIMKPVKTLFPYREILNRFMKGDMVYGKRLLEQRYNDLKDINRIGKEKIGE